MNSRWKNRTNPLLPPSWFIGLLALCLLTVGLLAGCGQSATSGVTSDATQPAAGRITDSGASVPSLSPQPSTPARFAEPPADDAAAGQLVEETWDAISMQGKRIGYARTIVSEVQENGRDLVRTSSFLRLVVSREGHTSEQTMRVSSYDTRDGAHVRFESRMASGPTEIVVAGKVEGKELVLNQSTLGQKQTTKLPWSPEWGGPAAVEQSLRRQPMKVGEKRTIRCLLAAFNVPGDVQLEAIGEEDVALAGGNSKKLLKVRAVMKVGQQQLEETRWLDERGEMLKSMVPSLAQETLRTTKGDALQPAASGPLDLMASSTVPLSGKLVPSPDAQKAVYRAHVKTGSIDGVFIDCPSQRVKLLDDQTAEITITVIQPDPVVGTLRVPSSTAADLAPNSFIQSDDHLITQIAAQAAGSEIDPWRIARTLEQFVQAAVKNKNYSQAFATAADVARTLEGDCTEHAVLYAALCRAKKIPARVAAGLIYYPPQKGFAYHMWTEVWIGDRWIPMDPTLGRGGIGPDHLKLAESNLAGNSPLADLLSIVQSFGRLELELIAMQ